MNPDHINPLQWHQAQGVARQSCSRVFRDGGTPGDALAAFGIKRSAADKGELTWAKAVECVAEALCAQPARRAA